ncbi:hypothetical protein [Pedobacter sp. V48]|uniref:hypothetical protein n=1 Tax=Pedobacter sp. V48 TaxID=509635 RepID=UPI0003E5A3D4|nr:hypothetical protein [Pedobacter sp. V48]ETZ24552.1 hypothetical protein N824_13620 [Pedobacter sp. V48]
MKFRIFAYAILSFAFINANGQSSFFKSRFNNTLNSGNSYNSKIRIKKYSTDGNTYNFLLLGYYLNANNMMYKSTNDISYLENNADVIKGIRESGLQNPKNGNSASYRWTAKIKSNQSNYSKNNQEFILYEGYVFRYIAEYYYLVSKLPNKSGLEVDVDFIKADFFKWYKLSMSSFGDDSLLQSLRTHMGSHWATLAMYLYILDNNDADKIIYKKVYSKYSNSLRANLKVVDLDGKKGYIWNSTWDKPFTKYLVDKSKKTKSEIQDVSHGNHIVQFVLDSYELHLNDWSLTDIQYFANTLKYRIWDDNLNKFSDNVDGTSLVGKYKGSGWKQSDGWMKLMMYDRTLYPIYKKFYLKNASIIDSSSLNLQFYSNFTKYENKFGK